MGGRPHIAAVLLCCVFTGGVVDAAEARDAKSRGRDSNSDAVPKAHHDGVYGTGADKLVMATGSPGELGLLRILAEAFAAEHEATVCWIKAGSGKSLELLRREKQTWSWSMLRVLFHGDPVLVNVYHALRQPDGRTPRNCLAASFVAFLTSARAQRLIREFGKDRYGAALYRDATYARKHD